MPTNLAKLEKIRVGAVNYRNAKPLVCGMVQPGIENTIVLSYDYPARLVDQLCKGIIDIGLIPVAAIPAIPGARMVGTHGIAADGKVGSVCIFSQTPIENINEVILDYQSRTSAALTRILFENYWKRSVNFLPSSSDGYIDDIRGQRAGLIIGDRALTRASSFSFIYDLGEIWKIYSGLPFVFARWVATRELPKHFLENFEEANSWGLDRLESLAKEWALPGVDMKAYFTEQIRYRLSEQHLAGLRLFQSLL